MLIAIKDKDKITLSISNCEDLFRITKADMVNPDNVPIITRDNVICGITAQERISDLMKYDDNLFPKEINGKSLLKETLPKIIQMVADEKGVDIKEFIKDAKWNNAAVVITQDKLFDITPKFYLREESNYVVHGYFSELMVGVMDQTKEMPAEDRIRKVYDTIEELIHRNCYPAVIIDNKERKVNIMEKKINGSINGLL